MQDWLILPLVATPCTGVQEWAGLVIVLALESLLLSLLPLLPSLPYPVLKLFVERSVAHRYEHSHFVLPTWLGENNYFLQNSKTISFVSLLIKFIIIGDFYFHIDKPWNQTSSILRYPLILWTKACKFSHSYPISLYRLSPLLTVNLPVYLFLTNFRTTSRWLQTWMPPLPRPTPRRQNSSGRKVMNSNDFKTDALTTNPAKNLWDLSNQYNSILSSLLDQYAPLLPRRMTLKPPQSIDDPRYIGRPYNTRDKWSVSAVGTRLLSTSITLLDRPTFVTLISNVKSAFHSTVIDENSTDQHSLWKVFNHILLTLAWSTCWLLVNSRPTLFF